MSVTLPPEAAAASPVPGSRARPRPPGASGRLARRSAVSGHVTRRLRGQRHLARRLLWLYAGLAGFGASLALLVRARLGLDPWDVLHQGIAQRLGIQIGWVVIAVSAAVLLAWIPLRQRPGLGTISNVVLTGLVTNVTLDVLPAPAGLGVRVLLLAAGIALNAVSTALYIGAGLGPGARDGIMTALAARGHSVRVVRTCVELPVLVIGYFLGGQVGAGTVAYAVLIGPLVHYLIPRLAIGQADPKDG
jgi:uncharacterized membrane protein YczE